MRYKKTIELITRYYHYINHTSVAFYFQNNMLILVKQINP